MRVKYNIPVIRNLNRFFWVAVKLCVLIINLARYDEWNIAKYFRKQGATIGNDCFIAARSLAMEPHLVTIGNHVWISRGVLLNTHDGGYWIFQEELPSLRITGKIVIEDNCLIGANAIILPNVTIGKNSIVGAGSVVINDIPPNSVVMGVPARVIGSTLKYKEKCISIWEEQMALSERLDEDNNTGSAKKSKKEMQKRAARLESMLDDHSLPIT